MVNPAAKKQMPIATKRRVLTLVGFFCLFCLCIVMESPPNAIDTRLTQEKHQHTNTPYPLVLRMSLWQFHGAHSQLGSCSQGVYFQRKRLYVNLPYLRLWIKTVIADSSIHGSGRPEEFHLQSPTDPYVSLSAHTAPASLSLGASRLQADAGR